MDEMARLDYAWELQEIRIRKRKLNDPDYPLLGPYREDVLSEISFHKKQAEYFKRRVPMKCKVNGSVIKLELFGRFQDLRSYDCPCCGMKIFSAVRYCDCCGQRLMWE